VGAAPFFVLKIFQESGNHSSPSIDSARLEFCEAGGTVRQDKKTPKIPCFDGCRLD
jgi:hypothetical protein